MSSELKVQRLLNPPVHQKDLLLDLSQLRLPKAQCCPQHREEADSSAPPISLLLNHFETTTTELERRHMCVC